MNYRTERGSLKKILIGSNVLRIEKKQSLITTLQIIQDALRDDCDSSDHCETNCCVDPILAPCFFVIFVLISQFVLVNVVVAVLMKHLEESNKRDAEGPAEPTGFSFFHF